MTDLAALGMLYLLAAEPTLLPEAPSGATGADIERRRQDEVHPCLRCGKRAQVAYIAQMHIGPRWLDLCPACNHAVRAAADADRSEDWPEEWRP